MKRLNYNPFGSGNVNVISDPVQFARENCGVNIKTGSAFITLPPTGDGKHATKIRASVEDMERIADFMKEFASTSRSLITAQKDEPAAQ